MLGGAYSCPEEKSLTLLSVSTSKANLTSLSPPKSKALRSVLSLVVVHKTMLFVVVPRSYIPTVRRWIRKRNRLATRQTTLFSPNEYYKGMQLSERMFDQLVEKGEFNTRQ